MGPKKSRLRSAGGSLHGPPADSFPVQWMSFLVVVSARPSEFAAPLLSEGTRCPHPAGASTMQVNSLDLLLENSPLVAEDDLISQLPQCATQQCNA
jgi:hypothetical protein